MISGCPRVLCPPFLGILSLSHCPSERQAASRIEGSFQSTRFHGQASERQKHANNSNATCIGTTSAGRLGRSKAGETARVLEGIQGWRASTAAPSFPPPISCGSIATGSLGLPPEACGRAGAAASGHGHHVPQTHIDLPRLIVILAGNSKCCIYLDIKPAGGYW